MTKTLRVALKDIFDTWVDVLDLGINSEQYVILPLYANHVCMTCGKKLSIRVTKKYVSFLCDCGCRVFYPPKPNGKMLSRWVTKEEYERGKNGN